MPVKGSSERVGTLVRDLDRACADESTAARVRAAANLYLNNGGVLPAKLRPECSDAGDPAPGYQLQRHRVLEEGFRLQAKAFMMTFNSRAFTIGTWGPFSTWVKAIARRLHARRWAACLEESQNAQPLATDSAEPTAVYHLHAYLWWTDGKGVTRRNTDDFVFTGVRPRFDVCVCQSPRGRPFGVAATHGLWYVSMFKLGTVFAEASYRAWHDYEPRPEWLRSLWAARKLTNAMYEEYSRRLRVGHADRKRDLTELYADERQQAVHDHVAAGLAQTAGTLKALRTFPQVEAFIESFSDTTLLRRPILALVGGTNLGKSILAAGVLKRVADVLQVPSFLEVTVEGDAFLDLTDFDVRCHAGVLLDGVGDAELLKSNREVLQGRPKACKTGRSPTMRFSTSYTLYRRAVVASFDLSADNLHMFDSDHWLSCPKNVVCLRLTAPAWETPGAPPSAPEPDRAEQMKSWPAAGVVAFAKARDLAGPAHVLFASSVNGADLLNVSKDVLIKEVRLTPFAAAKVIRARDAFLQGQ